MTEKDLEEFEKEFGFKLLPTGFKKPLSEITKEEYDNWRYNYPESVAFNSRKELTI